MSQQWVLPGMDESNVEPNDAPSPIGVCAFCGEERPLGFTSSALAGAWCSNDCYLEAWKRYANQEKKNAQTRR